MADISATHSSEKLTNLITDSSGDASGVEPITFTFESPFPIDRVPTGPKKRKEKRNGATPIAALHVVESRN